MRFSTSAILAFAAAVVAQTEGFDAMSTPTKDEYLTAGTSYSINWAPGTYTGSVTLSLLGGATPSTLQVLGDLGTVDNSAGTYSWSVDSSLGSLATYGIKITLGSDSSVFQYSFPFHISGASASSSAVSSSAVSVAATTSAAATTGYAVSTPVTSTTKAPETSSDCTTSTTSITIPSSYPVVSYPVASGNATKPVGTAATTLATGTTSTPAAQTSKVVVNGAPRAAAGSIALLGAVAAAVFAL